MKKILFASLAIFLLAASCGKQSNDTQNNQPTPTPTPVVTPTPSATPTVSVSGKVYETDYFKITVPETWTAKAANRKVYTGNCNNKQNCTSTYTTQPDPTSLNITKGNYILFVNSRAGQASGVEGGRFSEISSGAPSVDAIVLEQPSGECGSSESFSALVNNANNNRVDLYVGPKDNIDRPWCKVPTNGKTVWYFSYIIGQQRGYFNYFNVPEYSPGTGWVVTMAYNSKAVNSFPVKGSAELNQALSEMTNILSTLTVKYPVVYAPEVTKSIKNISQTLWSEQYEEGLNSNFVSCTDKVNTSSINREDVKSSYTMESLGPDGKTEFSDADIKTRIDTITNILKNAGWSKCNSVVKVSPVTEGYQSTDSIDVYKLGNELANVNSTHSTGKNGSSDYMDLTFLRLK